MSASNMFIQLAVAALIVVLTKGQVYEKCFQMIQPTKGDVCLRAQEVIKCYAKTKGGKGTSMVERIMNEHEKLLEDWKCPGKETVRVDFCNYIIYKGNYCRQEKSRNDYCFRSLVSMAKKYITGDTLRDHWIKRREEVETLCNRGRRG